MPNQDITITWQALTFLVLMAGNFFAIVWWASKLTSKADILFESINKINMDLKSRDEKLTASFNKIDNINERLLKIEFLHENGGHHKYDKQIRSV